jgi:hypothetical protein
MTDYQDWTLEPEFTDLAWTDEVPGDEYDEYPYEVDSHWWDADNADWYPEYVSDDDLPGMWTQADFL